MTLQCLILFCASLYMLEPLLYLGPPHEIESCTRDSLSPVPGTAAANTQLAKKLAEETGLS